MLPRSDVYTCFLHALVLTLKLVPRVHPELNLLNYTGHMYKVVCEATYLCRTEEHLLLSVLAGMQGLLEHASQGVW